MGDAKTHYTVKRLDEAETKSRDDEPRDEITRELAAHYAATWSVLIEKRSGTRWEGFAKIDVFHPEEPVDDETPVEQRVRELADEIVDLCEAEARVDGPTRFRVTGRPERGTRPTWGPTPFKFGPDALAGELEIEAKEAGVAVLTNVCTVVDRLARHLDRAWTRNQSMQDQGMSSVSKICAAVATLVEASNKVAGPLVELEKIRTEFRQAEAQIQADMEHERNSTDMFMRAAELIGQAVTAERRDQENATIDAEAREHSGTNGARPNATPFAGLYTEARELAGMLGGLTEEKRAALRATLTEDEWTTVVAASEARDLQTYDARFMAFYEAYRSRGREGAVALTSELGKILGFSALTVQRLVSNFERRNREKLEAD